MAWAMYRTSRKTEGAGGASRGRPEPSLRARALRYLARREHSRDELRRKLQPFAAEGEDVQALLDDFAARGWLSDARFAEQLARVKGRRFGPLRIAQQLREKGVGEEAIVAAVRASTAEGGRGIEAIWRSRFKAPPADARERARHARFLHGRGFPADEVLRFLKSCKENP